GTVLGTPIAPHYFITAKHVGGDSATLVYNGQTYHVTSPYDTPNADLRIWHVLGTFSSYAPLYTGNSAGGQTAVLIGRGTQRGSPVMVGASLKGWQWGTSDHVQSWGQNAVAGVVNFGPSYGDALRYDFNAGVNNEGALSNGDSGGGEFIND